MGLKDDIYIRTQDTLYIAVLVFIQIPCIVSAHTLGENVKNCSDFNSSSQEIIWKNIMDEYGSSINVPYSILRKVNDSSVIELRTNDDSVIVLFWTTAESRPGFPGNNPKSDMSLKKEDCDIWPPKHLMVRDDMAYYSCVLQGKVNYYLAKYNGFGSVTLFVKYPIRLRSRWDTFVKVTYYSNRISERYNKLTTTKP